MRKIYYPKSVAGIKAIQNIKKAKNYVLSGKECCRFEFGDSMMPILESGEYSLITPIKNVDEIEQGDAVFCECNGYLMIHWVKNIKDDKYLISTTSGYEYGWITSSHIFGKVISFKDRTGSREFVRFK